MCGIFGLITNNKINIHRNEFIECLNSINHRGPDDEGYKEIYNLIEDEEDHRSIEDEEVDEEDKGIIMDD